MDLECDPIDLLLEQHQALSDLFARHQEALVDRRWAEAGRLLEEYERNLMRHIRLEEHHLLSRCDTVEDARWPGAVYRAEHRRIEQLLRKAGDRLNRARACEITPAVLISLLDEERTLKHLVDHHHEREEKALFLELRGTAVCKAAGSLGDLAAGMPTLISRTQ